MSSKPPKTCDSCRKRKIKCVEDESDPTSKTCEGCAKLSLECTYDYVKKKPGRKNSFALAMKAAQTQPGGVNGHVVSGNGIRPQSPRAYSWPYPPLDTSLRAALGQPLLPVPEGLDVFAAPQTLSTATLTVETAIPAALPTPSSFSQLDGHSNGTGNLNGNGNGNGAGNGGGNGNGRVVPSSSFTLSPLGRGDFSLDWLDAMLDSGWTANDSSEPWGVGYSAQFASEQAQLLSLESPEHGFASSSTGPGTIAGMNVHARKGEPQLEDVTSWANISHFISLFLQYLYPLLPLVHRPTFAEALATRRDLRDSDFRALLLSIVAYVISQLPTTRLVNDQFDIEGLKRLQRRCHRTCKVLQRTYYGSTNLTQISTIIFDTFYLLSIGLGHTAASRLGQAVQLAFSMGMHSDAKTAALGLDAIEVQLRRRVFWQLYASDKTRAIPGPPMLINDFQGVPSLPEPVDDEFITSQGMFPQPPGRTSVLAGFVAISRVFKIISECFFHTRCIQNGGLLTTTQEWTTQEEDKLHAVLRELPTAIQDPANKGSPDLREVFGMQRANILITAAIAKFALFDLRAALNADEETLAHEREAIARQIYGLLMNIPVEDLASNGESVRGKVFHIACALVVQSPGSIGDQELIRDWCNMFSAISFVQMPTPAQQEVMDSRAPSNSPGPALSSGIGTGGTAGGSI